MNPNADRKRIISNDSLNPTLSYLAAGKKNPLAESQTSFTKMSSFAGSSYDGSFSRFHAHLRSLLEDLIVETERPKVLLPTLTSINQSLCRFKTLIETSDDITSMFKRPNTGQGRPLSDDASGKPLSDSNFYLPSALEQAHSLTEVDQVRMQALVKFETLLPEVRKLMHKFRYGFITAKENKERMARKLCTLVTSTIMHVRAKEMALSLNRNLNILASSIEMTDVMNFPPVSDITIESIDEEPQFFLDRLEKLLTAMAEADLFAKECKSALKDLGKGRARVRVFGDLQTELLDFSKNLRQVYFLCVTLLAKYYSTSEDRKQLAAKFGANFQFREAFVPAGRMNLLTIELLEMYKHYGAQHNSFMINVLDSYYSIKDNTLVIATQMPGTPLNQYLYGDMPLSQRDSILFAKQILEALKFTHANKIALGTIASHTIYIVELGQQKQVKLMDIKELCDEDMKQFPGLEFEDNRRRRTFKDADLGDFVPGLDKARYIAPELLEVDDSELSLIAARRTFTGDMYSFAVLFWEIIQQRIPYKDATSIRDLAESIKRGYRPSNAVHEGNDNILTFELSDIVEGVIVGCWAPAAFKRPTAADLLKKRSSMHTLYKKYK